MPRYNQLFLLTTFDRSFALSGKAYPKGFRYGSVKKTRPGVHQHFFVVAIRYWYSLPPANPPFRVRLTTSLPLLLFKKRARGPLYIQVMGWVFMRFMKGAEAEL